MLPGNDGADLFMLTSIDCCAQNIPWRENGPVIGFCAHPLPPRVSDTVEDKLFSRLLRFQALVCFCGQTNKGFGDSDRIRLPGFESS